MTNDIAIRIKQLSKRYHIYARPMDRLKEMVLRGQRFHTEFVALDDVSFEVPRGATMALVGHNGSGKSTLLQIIAGTLQPTSGSIEVNGRVAALLELGAGFNPEFTGRENVYLNGAIMGIPRQEMERRFPEIADFADIGNFIDQPVKTYSSGMYVRLAFATAINVDPDILLVDEALAVGDAAFQNKCMRRIKELQAKGVTLLFVSHDPGAVKALCHSAVLMDHGRKIAEGDAYEIINRYQALIMAEGDETLAQPAELEASLRHGNRHAEILGLALCDEHGDPATVIRSARPATIKVKVRFHRPVPDAAVGIMIRNRLGLDLYGTNTHRQGIRLGPFEAGDEIDVSFEFPCRLGRGKHSIAVAVHSPGGTSYDWLDDTAFFEVIDTPHSDGLANLEAQVSVQSFPRVLTERGNG